jgi:hypothetical protein
MKKKTAAVAAAPGLLTSDYLFHSNFALSEGKKETAYALEVKRK